MSTSCSYTIIPTVPLSRSIIKPGLRLWLLAALVAAAQTVAAQVGEHRSDFALGVGGGYVLSDVGFTPKVTQGYHGGFMGGVALRYVCEKYFNTIASVVAEVNYAQVGWKEDILTKLDQPVINGVTGQPERYSRTLNYVQVPFMAHLAWGRERSGCNFFVQAGPQFGAYLSESSESNFRFEEANMADRSNSNIAQDTMKVENSFDYGIAAGLGMELSTPRLGHFLIEARYYYGLGNIYGATKRDYFSKSNLGNIVLKFTYLFDLKKTNNPKIK